MVSLNSRKGSTFCRAASSANWIAYGLVPDRNVPAISEFWGLPFMSENQIPDPLTVLLIPISRLVMPDTGGMIPDPTPFFAVGP